MRLFYGRIALLLFFLGGSAAGSQAQVINMAVPNRSVAQVAYYAALERGYYREEGLEVRLIVMSAPLTVNALLAANVEFSGQKRTNNQRAATVNLST
jgi:ABC-type nitrate/sulfonate/bicarbonate transport system substrate-binding protein